MYNIISNEITVTFLYIIFKCINQSYTKKKKKCINLYYIFVWDSAMIQIYIFFLPQIIHIQFKWFLHVHFLFWKDEYYGLNGLSMLYFPYNTIILHILFISSTLVKKKKKYIIIFPLSQSIVNSGDIRYEQKYIWKSEILWYKLIL